MNTSADDGSPERAGYRRSAGSPRGEARRRELLDRVTDDLAVNGLVDFSLRRAARAAGTTHKVLLYHFDGADDLLRQAIGRLREQAHRQRAGRHRRRTWPRRRWGPGYAPCGPVLMGEEPGLRVLDQAIGLAMYDPDRYAGLGAEASPQYLPALMSICPADWPDRASSRSPR